MFLSFLFNYTFELIVKIVTFRSRYVIIIENSGSIYT